MIPSILRLLRLRLRLWWNTIKHRSIVQKIGYGFAALFFVAIAAGILFASWALLRFMTSPRLAATMLEIGMDIPVEDLLTLMPVTMMFSAFFLGLFVNFGTLLQTLYLSGDMEFLLAAPIPPQAVFASKMIQAVVPSLLLFSLFTGPSLFGLGFSQGYNFLYYLAVPLVLVLLVVSGGGVSALLVMGVVKVVSPRRAAEVLAVAGSAVGLFCSQIGNLMNFSDNVDVSPEQFGDAFSGLTRFVSVWNPIAWPGIGVDALGKGDWLPGIGFTALTLTVTGTLLLVTFSASQRLYFSGWARVQLGTTAKKKARKKSRSTSNGPRVNLLGWLPPPVAAVVLKDARVFRRDLRNLSQLISPIILAIFWSFFLFRNQGSSDLPAAFRSVSGVGSLGIGLFIAWSFTMRFGLGAFSLEGKQWWILKTSPIAPKHLVLSKYLIAYFPALLLGELYLIVSVLLQRGGIGQALYHMVVLAVVLAGLAALMMAFGIFGAKFDWDNPNQVTTGAAGCLAPLASMIFMALSVGAFAGLPILGEFLDWNNILGYAAGFGLGLILTAVIGVVPLWAARSKLSTLGGEA